MTPEQISDGLVKAGVLERCGVSYRLVDVVLHLTANQLINDWRVAGACLERIISDPERGIVIKRGINDSPRAICEVFVRAQEQSDG